MPVQQAARAARLITLASAASLAAAVAVLIGAGVGCDGQVLVCYDFLGMDPTFAPRFVKRYANLHAEITRATTSSSKAPTTTVSSSSAPACRNRFCAACPASTWT